MGCMRAAIGVLMLAALAACSPALDWREARPEDSGLLLLMPCRPDHFQRSVLLAGMAVRLALDSCSAGDTTWAVAHADVGDPARVGAALDALREATARNVGAAAGSPLALSVSGSTPQAQSVRVVLQGQRPDGQPLQAQVAVFARGTRVFQATALGARLPAEGAETFFGSLRFPP